MGKVDKIDSFNIPYIDHQTSGVPSKILQYFDRAINLNRRISSDFRHMVDI